MKTRIKTGLIIVPLCVLLFMGGSAMGKSVFPEDSLVRQRCSACHKLDEQGNVEVIEETRKSPEEWIAVVERMIRLNSAPLEDAKFFPVIKELSRYLCMSPAEMAKIAYINSDENSQYKETPKNKIEERIYTACVRCHTWGKIASHRKSRDQWLENRLLHLGYYPTTVPQMREMDWPKESMELVDPLAEIFPLVNPEWSKWMKSRKEQDLSGQWRVAGYQPGLGYYAGSYTFQPNPAKGEDEYLVSRRVTYENGFSLVMSGEAVLYGEYHPRYAMAPTPLTGRIEGVFDLDAKAMGFTGKWWTIVQDSNSHGVEKFYKTDAPSRVFALYPRAFQSGVGKDQYMTLVGVHLPKSFGVDNISFPGPYVKVAEMEAAGDGVYRCKMNIGKSAPPGPMKFKIEGAAFNEAVVIHGGVDGIRIVPSLARARVSCGAAYPPHGVQFTALGVSYGPDRKPGTADDLTLEPVEARWWLEEEKTRENDDDLKYLMAPITNGLYTPVTTYGPIQERNQHREGVGLIAVGAEYTGAGNPLKARARLVVTVPDFIPHIK
ncbi:MAG: quinohemoprotein amine dehydrogenase subunit alpha [Desulfobacterales bacterium]|nr:quinohemoprotein amine dehydrogenase subunit alpha [Desulfobacterales bacterium]